MNLNKKLLTSDIGFKAPILYPNKNELPNRMMKAAANRFNVRPYELKKYTTYNNDNEYMLCLNYTLFYKDC